MTLWEIERDEEGVPVRLHANLEAKHSPVCATCGLKARMWSGVTDWLVDGLWCGWCSTECRTRWHGEAKREMPGSSVGEGSPRPSHNRAASTTQAGASPADESSGGGESNPSSNVRGGTDGPSDLEPEEGRAPSPVMVPGRKYPCCMGDWRGSMWAHDIGCPHAAGSQGKPVYVVAPSASEAEVARLRAGLDHIALGYPGGASYVAMEVLRGRDYAVAPRGSRDVES